MKTLILFFALALASCTKDETISGYVDANTVYQLHEVNGDHVKYSATISFPENGRVVGKAPCNSYSGTQSAPIPWFKIGPVASTKMACPDLDHESAYFQRLSKMTQVETLGNVLILRNEAGDEMLFEAVQQ